MAAPAARADFRRHLVAPGLAAPPPGATVVDERITQGVPHAIALTGDLSLLLVVPTGLATAWRDAVPTAVVTASAPQAAPALAPAAPAPAGPGADTLPVGAPARLVVLRSGAIAGAVPFSLGLRVVIGEADPVPGTRVELQVREWDLRAGSLRGPGDVGSFVRLAWRRIDEASAVFGGFTSR